jgi:hypothetical protein
MSEFIGRQIELGIGVESTRGTALTVADKWVKNVTADIISRAEKVNDDNSQGVLEDSVGSKVVKKWFDGDVSGILNPDLAGYFFMNILGDVSTTTVTGAVKSHVFTMAQNIIHPTLSVFAKDGAVSQRVFNEGVVNTLEITANPDDYVRFTSNIICSESASNSDTPDYVDDYTFIGKDVSVKIADTEAGLAGATVQKVKDLTVTFDASAISDFNLGSFSPDNYNNRLSIEGSFEKNYVDDTFETLFTGNGAKYMQILIEGDAVYTGANRPTINMVFNRVQVTDWDRSGGNDELVVESVSFKAFYNQTDGEQSTVTIKNLTASYEVGS